MALGEIRFDSPGREQRAMRARPLGSARVDTLLACIAVACLAAVGAALVTQHRYGMDPCPWCILQRIIFVAIALVAIVGLVWRRVTGRLLSTVLVLLLALAGIATALWQHFVAALSSSCGLSLADRIVQASRLGALLPGVFEPRATCADAAVNLLGVPYEFWSLAMFALVAIAALAALPAARRR